MSGGMDGKTELQYLRTIWHLGQVIRSFTGVHCAQEREIAGLSEIIRRLIAERDALKARLVPVVAEYERMKHQDCVLADSEWCEGSVAWTLARDLWLVIKGACEVAK